LENRIAPVLRALPFMKYLSRVPPLGYVCGTLYPDARTEIADLCYLRIMCGHNIYTACNTRGAVVLFVTAWLGLVKVYCPTKATLP
jgi:hypothetical protein